MSMASSAHAGTVGTRAHPLDLSAWPREEKLAWIAQQLARGELVIRQATAEERLRYGIHPAT